MNPRLTAALQYAMRGWAVLPLEVGGKRPITPHGVNDATTDPARIMGWWKQTPEANIGIATGERSGIIALDVDTKGGKVGEQSLAALVAQGRALPETLTQQTWSGGRHYVFVYAPGVKNSASLVGKDLDVRGDGGYITVAPSQVEDGEYRWLNEVEPAPIPAWLIERVKSASASNGNGRKPYGWQDSIVRGETPAARNSAMWDLLNRWREKRLSDDEIRAFAYALAEKWDYDAEEYEKLENQLARVLSREPIFETPEVEIVQPGDQSEDSVRPLPAIARQGLAHEYASMMSEACGTDYNYWYFAYLSFFAALVCTRVRFNSFTRRPLRPYTVLVGEKNTGKSQARDLTHDFFSGLHEKGMLGGVPPYLRVFNAQSDAGLMSTVLRHRIEDSAVVLTPDEFAIVLKKCAIQNSTLGQTLTELFEKEITDAWTKDDKKSGTIRVHLLVLGGTTPLDYAAHFDTLTALGGLASRIWLVAPEGMPGARRRIQPPPPARLHDFSVRTRDAVRAAVSTPMALDLLPAAATRLEAWCAEHEAALRTEIGVRIPDYIEKMAALVNLTRDSADNHGGGVYINELDTEIGIALGGWEMDVRRMYAIDEADSRHARYAMQIRRALWKLLRQNPVGAVLDRELRRAVNFQRWSPGTYEGIVERLVQAGEMEGMKLPVPEGGGHGPRAWRIGREGLAGVAEAA